MINSTIWLKNNPSVPSFPYSRYLPRNDSNALSTFQIRALIQLEECELSNSI